MQNNKYKLIYLPLFYEDLKKTVEYISVEKQNISAALNLLDAVEQAILERLPVAESFEPYKSRHDRENMYYRIYVDNFIIFYVVIDEGGDQRIMEVRRIIYKGRDRDSIV